jgi:hypothetical protein
MAEPRPVDCRELRLTAMAVTDSCGTGLFIAGSAIYFVQAVHLRPSTVGLGISLAGLCGLITAVPIGLLADRIGVRTVLALLSLGRAAGMAGYVFVHSARSFLPLAAVLGVADGAVPSLNQSLVALVVPGQRKVKVQAAMRAWRNAGFAVGAGLAAAILALHTEAAYRAIFLGDAATFLVVVAVVATLQPRPSTSATGRASRRTSLRVLGDRRLLIGAAMNGILSLHMTVLGVGLPLWLVRHTQAPHALTGGLLALNTVMAVALQVKLSAGAADTAGALRALRRSGFALAATCLLLASSAGSGAAVACLALIAATVMLTLGEIWQSAGAWGLSFALAPEDRRSSVLSVFGAGVNMQLVLAPLVLTAVVFPAGRTGWAVMGALLLMTGFATTRLLGTPGDAADGRTADMAAEMAR